MTTLISSSTRHLPHLVCWGLLLVGVSGSLSEVIPTDRRIDWQPGVPLGIPARTTIFANVTNSPYNADKTGNADAAPAIQNAINACPSGQVVFVPAGAYRLNSPIAITKGIVLRGAGPHKTFLSSYADWHALQIGDWPASPVATSVSGNPAKGATSLTVASVSSPQIAVGDLIVIDQKNDGVEVLNVDDESRDNNTRCLSQITKVMALNGNGPYVLQIDPPLYHTFSATLLPQVWKLNQGSSLTTYAGIEDLTVERISPITMNWCDNIKLVAAAYCWIRNVESRKTTWWHVDLDRSFRCEIRDSFFNDGYFHGTGGCAYGVTCDNRSTGHLIENNIFYHLRHAMVVKGGATGCVFGYNYSLDTYQADGWLAPDMFVHGAHATMNLFEGNIGTKMDGDFTHGSGSYNTFLRNYATRTSAAEAVQGGRWVVNMDATQTYANFVGNVLGASNLTWAAEETGASRSSTSGYVWSWGFRGDGDSSREDTRPRDTALRHGNYNAYSGQTSWDPAIADHELPVSLYLATRPAYFGGSAWPSIGPDLHPMVGMLPARERQAGRPLPPSNLRIVPGKP